MVYIYTLESEIARQHIGQQAYCTFTLFGNRNRYTINMNLFYLPVVALFFKKKDP